MTVQSDQLFAFLKRWEILQLYIMHSKIVTIRSVQPDRWAIVR